MKTSYFIKKLICPSKTICLFTFLRKNNVPLSNVPSYHNFYPIYRFFTAYGNNIEFPFSVFNQHRLWHTIKIITHTQSSLGRESMVKIREVCGHMYNITKLNIQSVSTTKAVWHQNLHTFNNLWPLEPFTFETDHLPRTLQSNSPRADWHAKLHSYIQQDEKYYSEVSITNEFKHEH